MTEKTPIERDDIRKGDSIREEYKEGGKGAISYPFSTAIEYVAQMDRNTINKDNAARWYLLDRPETYVKVPQSALDELRAAHEVGYCNRVSNFFHTLDSQKETV